VLIGILLGAAFGIVFGMVSYAFTGGKRDFVSRQALQAARYDVRCDAEVLAQARKVLGIRPGWPPAAPTSAPTTGPAPESESESDESS
jgi:hypothetical protein